jgi:YHS domain-containing protein
MHALCETRGYGSSHREGVMSRFVTRFFAVLAVAVPVVSLAQENSASSEIPAAFVPFEGMIGSWKGTAVPKANRVKGWPETHMWAWKFAKGSPIGMSIELKGGKTVSKGELRFDAAKHEYRLEGVDPAGKAVAFAGVMDKAGKALVLSRIGSTPEGKERLTIRPNSNRIRYQMLFDRQEPGAPQFKNVVDVGLTKEGESFAAGGSAADLPKCIVTGGAATLNVVYEGKSYPLCCTGCRDEFNDNPAKYVKKALLRAQAASKTASKPAARAKGDSEFDGLVEESKAKDDKPSSKDK